MMLKTILSIGAALSVGAAALAQGTIAITNGQLHMTSADGDVIEGGTVLIRNGRIAAVGDTVRIPDGAEVIDAGGNPVTPGFFSAMTAVGLIEIGAVGESNDSRANNDSLTAALQAQDGFNEDSSVIDVTRAGGTTRAFVNPAVGSGLFGGCGMVITMVRGPEAIAEECVANSVLLGNSGSGRTGGSRMAAFATFRRALADAESYAEDPEAYRANRGPNQLSVLDAEALGPVASGERQLMVYVHGASDIRRVLKLKDRYGLDIVLVGAAEAWRVADELAQADVPVIIDPLANLPESFERMGATELNAPRLAEAGVTVAFYDPGVNYTSNARLLPQLAGNAVRAGMSHADAMRAVTLTPAELYGLGGQLGTLQRGKLADVVVWTGDPFEMASTPTAVLVEGEITSLETRQSKLAERYKDLTRGDRPIAYRP